MCTRAHKRNVRLLRPYIEESLNLKSVREFAPSSLIALYRFPSNSMSIYECDITSSLFQLIRYALSQSGDLSTFGTSASVPFVSTHGRSRTDEKQCPEETSVRRGETRANQKRWLPWRDASACWPALDETRPLGRPRIPVHYLAVALNGRYSIA